VSGTLNGLPSELGAWQGPASVAFAGSSLNAAGAANSGAMSFLATSFSVRAYARELEDAQRDAVDAIGDARDAKERIRDAERAIEDAARRAEAAGLAILAATARLVAAAATAKPDLDAQADLWRAQQALDEAQAAERRARRALEDARDALDRAQARGARAADRARDAASLASVAVGAAGSGIPPLTPLGAAATPVVGGSGTVGPVPPLLPLSKLPPSVPMAAHGRRQPELGPYRPPGPPEPFPRLIPVDQKLAETLTDLGTSLAYGGAASSGVAKRNQLLKQHRPGAPTRPGGPPTGPDLINRTLSGTPGGTVLRIGGKGLPVVGAGVDYAAHKAGGDSTGRALRKTAINTGATAAGAAGGGLLCGGAAAATLGAGAASCPILIPAGTAVGAAGGWAINKGIDALESIIP
jgi:hypothetical protein